MIKIIKERGNMGDLRGNVVTNDAMYDINSTRENIIKFLQGKQALFIGKAHGEKFVSDAPIFAKLLAESLLVQESPLGNVFIKVTKDHPGTIVFVNKEMYSVKIFTEEGHFVVWDKVADLKTIINYGYRLHDNTFLMGNKIFKNGVNTLDFKCPTCGSTVNDGQLLIGSDNVKNFSDINFSFCAGCCSNYKFNEIHFPRHINPNTNEEI